MLIEAVNPYRAQRNNSAMSSEYRIAGFVAEVPRLSRCSIAKRWALWSEFDARQVMEVLFNLHIGLSGIHRAW